MDWKEQWKDKVISAEAAARLVKSGDMVRIGLGRTPPTVVAALAKRRNELQNVTVWQAAPRHIQGVEWWRDQGWQASFHAITEFPSPESRPGILSRVSEVVVCEYSLGFKQREEAGREDSFSPDVYLMQVSPPDERGICSLGPYPWYSKIVARRAKIVIGEVYEGVSMFGGDDFIHISDIDYLVERELPPRERGARAPLGIQEEEVAGMGQLIATLIKDGDCIQIGGGEASEAVCPYLLDKNDLGIHTEVIQRGMLDLMQAGVANGKRKNFHKDRAVGTGINTADPHYEEYARNNPAIEMLDVEYVNNIRNIATNDNMVSIQTCLAMDLSGQIASEGLGTQIYSAPGGQTSFAIGSMLSKGGRSIFVFASTAKKGTISRIVPVFEPGTAVTVPRAWVDYVVTEHGVVNLQFKTLRKRAEALISIAHPKFREELTAQARKMYWP